MFQLLSLWTQYVEVIYMPESEIHVISAVERMEARPEDTAYGFRTQESDVKNRLSTLFSDSGDKKKDDQIDDEDNNSLIKEDYETVNEGLTTDTTEAPQAAMRRGEYVPEGSQEAKASN